MFRTPRFCDIIRLCCKACGSACGSYTPRGLGVGWRGVAPVLEPVRTGKQNSLCAVTASHTNMSKPRRRRLLKARLNRGPIHSCLVRIQIHRLCQSLCALWKTLMSHLEQLLMLAVLILKDRQLPVLSFTAECSYNGWNERKKNYEALWPRMGKLRLGGHMRPVKFFKLASRTWRNCINIQQFIKVISPIKKCAHRWLIPNS